MPLTRRQLWMAGLALAVVALAAVLVWRVTERSVAPSADIERQLDAVAANDPYMAALKRWFPADYARLRQALLDDLKSARTLDEVQTRAMHRAREQADRTAGHVAAAPAADLAAVVQAERAVVRRLQTEDERLCAQFGMTGLPPGTRTSAETARLISRAAEARVKAARDGLDAPAAHDPPSEADLAALRASMVRAGASEALADLVLSPAVRSAPPGEQCAGSVAFYDALADLPEATAARWMSAITAQAARSPAAAP